MSASEDAVGPASQTSQLSRRARGKAPARTPSGNGASDSVKIECPKCGKNFKSEAGMQYHVKKQVCLCLKAHSLMSGMATGAGW